VGTRAEPRSREEDADRIRLKLDIGLDAVLEQEGGVGESQ
jgi:hypothetical protein